MSANVDSDMPGSVPRGLHEPTVADPWQNTPMQARQLAAYRVCLRRELADAVEALVGLETKAAQTDGETARRIRVARQLLQAAGHGVGCRR